MGLRADAARPQRVSGSARIDSRRAESARNPIAVHVKFGDDCANAQPGLSQWTAAFNLKRIPVTSTSAVRQLRTGGGSRVCGPQAGPCEWTMQSRTAAVMDHECLETVPAWTRIRAGRAVTSNTANHKHKRRK